MKSQTLRMLRTFLRPPHVLESSNLRSLSLHNVTRQVSSRRAAEECVNAALRRVRRLRTTRRTATALVITAARREDLTSYCII